MQQFTIHSLSGSGSAEVVEVEPDATLLDLRYLLFSLTDISPERILLHVAGRTHHPNDELDSRTTLSSAGITITTKISYSDSDQPMPVIPPEQRKDSKLPKQTITVDHLKAALQQCGTETQSFLTPPGSASSGDTDKFLAKVRTYYHALVAYEDKDLQEKALALVPLETLQTQAEEKHKTDAKYPTYEHALAKELLHWFKNSFFTWTDTPSCWSCGTKTTLADVLEPSPTESKYKASRTELFSCPKCGAETRFPRYNDVAKLLETRRGRCGEWAQAFTLIARAAGLRVRSVHDWTDHVWTEIWCGRWVHADCCENVLDEPLLYEVGWKKKLNYCIATGAGCVIDVTRRYTQNYEALRDRRTLADEGLLQVGLRNLNTEALVRLDRVDRIDAVRRCEQDMEALAKGSGETPEELPGRQSGSTEWVQSRGEDGSGK